MRIAFIYNAITHGLRAVQRKVYMKSEGDLQEEDTKVHWFGLKNGEMAKEESR